MSLQTNYWLQKAAFYEGDAAFVKTAELRRTGMENEQPFYQPVDDKAFMPVCGKLYEAKDYPLSIQNMELHGEAYDCISGYLSRVREAIR